MKRVWVTDCLFQIVTLVVLMRSCSLLSGGFREAVPYEGQKEEAVLMDPSPMCPQYTIQSGQNRCRKPSLSFGTISCFRTRTAISIIK
ncbi:UNVERIFIED_CONTAM: hypothetical protein FKN15_011396 [Acipenser sinensis]